MSHSFFLTAAPRRPGLGKAVLGVATALAIATAPQATSADGYQYIISGNPVAAATENSCVVASSGTALVTGTRAAPTTAAQLEARFRTWDESDGIALRSDKVLAFTLVFR